MMDQLWALLKKDSYDQFSLYANITSLFKFKLNAAHDKAIIVPKTINARTWIKNYKLEIFIQEAIDSPKPKKRKTKPKEYKRFYNQFSNNKSY